MPGCSRYLLMLTEARIFEPVAIKLGDEKLTKKWDGIFESLYKETHVSLG